MLSTATERSEPDNYTNKRKRSLTRDSVERNRRTPSSNSLKTKDTTTSSPEKKIKLEEVKKFIIFF